MGFVTFERGPCCSIATITVPVIVTAQIKPSQIHQSATIVSEQAVSIHICTWNERAGGAACTAQPCARDGMNTQPPLPTSPKAHTQAPGH